MRLAIHLIINIFRCKVFERPILRVAQLQIRDVLGGQRPDIQPYYRFVEGVLLLNFGNYFVHILKLLLLHVTAHLVLRVVCVRRSVLKIIRKRFVHILKRQFFGGANYIFSKGVVC